MDGPLNILSLSAAKPRTSVLRPVGRSSFWLMLLLAGSCYTSRAVAEEPFIPFIEGLRERSYFDTAIEYIDAISQRGDLPAEVRSLLDLERGVTLQQKGAASRVPEDREQAFTESEQALRKFVSENGQHPQAALANSMLGELLFERAKSLIWKTAEIESADERRALQDSARNLIDQAKGIYQTAQDQYKILYDAFPKFIDESKDEDQYKLRQEAEAKYLRAWFNLVRCTYERGQTFDKGSEERKKTLIEAADLFEKIHTSRRTNQIGLHARLMMGKCFQEQDDLGRALGIYNEMLSHKSENPAVEVLKGIAQHYRLICLNDPQKNDHQLVIQEAAAWLQANRQLSTTQSGLGILWEKAIAEEKLGGNRELSESDKENILRAAMNDAQQVGKYPGAYKDPASAMSRRLKLSLGDKDREPRDFATAFERARGMIAQIQQLSDDISRAADQNERTLKQTALSNHLNEVGRLLQLALDLKDTDSDPKAVAQVRYLLSFVLLRQGKALDAMILSTFCLEYDAKADPDTALNATEIAMAAAVAAWNESPVKDRDFETRALRDVCEKILKLYPQSSRGGEARMRLGSVYRTMNQPLEGAKWYLQVPEADPQYASARINAGQSYWTAWTQQSALAAVDPEGEQVPPQDMQAWKTEARNLLTQGIQLTRQKLGEAAKPTEELAAAEVSLASILNLDGEFPATIDRLTKGAENSVVAAIEVPDGTIRPEDGIQSKSFAGLTYRLLLRAYVGTQQIDQALQTMTKLERVGGEDILAAYTQLGIELQEELRRLKMSGENERLAQVRDSFEKFLQKVYDSRNKSDYNSLLWIGETYYGLGQGVAGDPISAATYYAKAGDAYSEILSGGLATPDSKNAVQLRLARCRRQQKQFDEALKIVEEILTQNPMTLDAQFEAAHILTDWGAENDPAKFTDAIQGKKDATGKATVIWGWSQLSRRLQQISAKDPQGEIRNRFVDSRFELSNCRRRFASVSAADADKQRKAAMAEVTSFVQAVRDLDDVAFARFDRLYQDLQADLGQAPTPLERNLAAAEPAEPTPDAPAANREKTPAEQAAQPVVNAEPEGAGWLLPVLGLSLCAGLAGGFYVFLRKPRHKVRIPGSATAPKFSAMAVLDGSSASAIPEGLSFETPAIPDFRELAAAGGGRKGAPASRSAVKSTAPATTSESATRQAPATKPAPTTEPRAKTPAASGEAPPVRRPAPAAAPASAPSGKAPAASVPPTPVAKPAATATPVPSPSGGPSSSPAAGASAPAPVQPPAPPRVRPAAPAPGSPPAGSGATDKSGAGTSADAVPKPRARPVAPADGSKPAAAPSSEAVPKPRPRPVAPPADGSSSPPGQVEGAPKPRPRPAPPTDGADASGTGTPSESPPRPRPGPVAPADAANPAMPNAPRPEGARPEGVRPEGIRPAAPKPAAPAKPAAEQDELPTVKSTEPRSAAPRPASPKPAVSGSSTERGPAPPAGETPVPRKETLLPEP